MFLAALNESVLVWDGATGTEYQKLGLTAEDFALKPEHLTPEYQELLGRVDGNKLEGCNEILCLTRPDLIQNMAKVYFDAGSDIVESNSFGSTSIVLGEYNIPELVSVLCSASTTLARKAADQASKEQGKPKFVAAGLGPGTKLISLGQASWSELEATYCDGFTAHIEAGADVLLLETLQDLLMIKAGVVAAKRAMANTGKRVPIIVQVTIEQTGTLLLGSDIAAVLNWCECHPEIVAIGMNCATGPAEMAPFVKFLGENSTRPISIQPNAGLPQMERGQAVYKLSPEELANYHTRFVNENGVALPGGCCGTTPEHIKHVVGAVGGQRHSANAYWLNKRSLFPGFDFQLDSPEKGEALNLKGCSSLYMFQPYKQDSSFLIVGERTNANGSKAFREMLAAENWQGLVEMAREAEGEGSHLLDICTAYVGRNEERDMTKLLSLTNQHVTVPTMIDSTEINVVEAALQCVAGKPLINSINFEDGEARTEAVLSLCNKYGAGVVALTIDESGMAKTLEHKLQVAERLLAKTRSYNLPDHDVFLDFLTFTLGSGDEEFRTSALATIDAIREIKKRYPTVNTTLGVSNVSFGLKPVARVVLNSVFLELARKAGLDSAIVHASKIKPRNQIDSRAYDVALELIEDKRAFA